MLSCVCAMWSLWLFILDQNWDEITNYICTLILVILNFIQSKFLAYSRDSVSNWFPLSMWFILPSLAIQASILLEFACTCSSIKKKQNPFES